MSIADLISCRETKWRVPPEIGELRVAMLGAGARARQHLEILETIDGVRLAAVCSRATESGETLAAELGVERVYQDADRMLAESDADAVIVAVSPEATLETCTRVARTGTPCLIETPVGCSEEDCRRLADAASESRCLTLVGVNRRYSSVINQALLAVLQQGPVRGVSVEVPSAILGDRSTMADAIAAVDLLRMIGGEVASVRAATRDAGASDGGGFSASVEFESGTLGAFTACSRPGRGFALTINGCGVAAELFPLEQGFLDYETGRRIKLRPAQSDTRFEPGLYAQNTAFLQAVCEAFDPPFPASDLRDHVATIALVEQLCVLVGA